mgnify:CR=1 FL=1
MLFKESLTDMVASNSIYQQLKAHGRRMTPQRRAIIQILMESDGHHTADDILSKVRALMPDIAHATVYNTLHELTEMGIVTELNLGLGERRYDINTSNHAHLVCLNCARVEDVPYDFDALELAPEHRCGFDIIDQRVIYRGYCPACAAEVNEVT